MQNFKVEFYKEQVVVDTIQNEYLLLFVVRGSISVQLELETFYLDSKDVIMINGNRHFKFQTQADTLLLVVSIQPELLCALCNTRVPRFQCCSVKHSSVKYEKLKYLIYDLLGEYALEINGMNAKKLSILYKICDYLIHSFLLSDNQISLNNPKERLDPVFIYIAEHFSEQISLPLAAKQVHIAPESLSRLFKKNTGITFVQYVTNIRLNHAVSQLMQSQLSISEIALNSGFSTASQFNKVFKRKFKLSPSEYRQKSAERMKNTGREGEQSDRELLKEYRSKTRMMFVKEEKIRLQSISVDSTNGKETKNPWGSMLYLGFASRILSGSYQKQIQFLKHKLDFSYGSINGLFSPEFGLIEQRQAEQLNFVNLDHILDFLVENGIRPLIVFDNQTLKMLKNLNEIQEISIIRIFSSARQFITVTEKILDHVVNRYGLKEVSNWKFVIWYYVYKQTLMGISGKFVELWDEFFETVRMRIPNACIGGVSYSASMHRNSAVQFFSEWKIAKHMPDFITINSFPYREAEEPTKMNAIRQNVDSFFQSDLDEMYSILEEAQFPKRPIVALEWNLSFVQRNAFNDMAAKAAIMMKHMVNTLGEVDDVCYWHASDLFAGDFDAKKILNGACGLLSSDGFCKPSYYALLFFKQLYNYLVDRGEHYIVTKDGFGHFAVILFNNKLLNYEYYSSDEARIGTNDDQKIFSNHDALEITLQLKNVENRIYSIRKQVLGPEFGSILDEWRRLGMELELTLNEISYLKRKSIPHRKNETIQSKKNVLVLQETLKEHEVMLIHIN